MAQVAKQTTKAKGDSLEAAVHVLESAILKLSPLYNDKTFRIQGKKTISIAGVHHELDIWVSVELGHGYDSVFIFECKNWTKKVTKNDVIVFSEKIKVAQAQKGFFVAKTFTRDALAQAKADPRIQLLRVSEVALAEVPTFLQYFHAVEQTSCHANCNVKLKVDQETGEAYPLDLSTAKLVLDGQIQTMSAYIEDWSKEVVGETTNRFPSLTQPENTYTLPFEDMRVFENGMCFVNDKPVAHMKLTGHIEVRVWRGELESRFEVESRGRVFRAVVKMPTAQIIMSTHELMTGTPGTIMVLSSLLSRE
jgi:hypothetical protein